MQTAVAKRIAYLERRGQILSIKNLTRELRDILHPLLTYDYVNYLTPAEARKRGIRVEVIPTECYQDVIDPDKLVPPQLMTGFGFYDRIQHELAKRGYKLVFRDNTQRNHDEKAYQPIWKRMEEVSWRWRQFECVKKIAAREHGRVICATGWGKSFIISQLARLFPYARIDVTTHARDVLDMLYGDLSDHLPDVGIVHGSKKKTGHRVMCYSGKSLHHADGRSDFLFVDECHEFATPDYFRKLLVYQHTRRFGFSANAPGDRMDGADFELEGILGPVLMEVPYQEAVDHNCIVPIRVLMVDVTMDTNPCSDCSTDTAKERWGLWRNSVRNQKIASIAHRFRSLGKQVLIMVNTVEHAAFLKGLLPEFEMVYSEGGLSPADRRQYCSWGLIPEDEPEMTFARRKELTKNFETGELRGAIATGVWSRGVNFKQLPVLIRGDAKSSAVADAQIPGRLSRLSTDKPYGVLVDFWDQFDPGYRRKAATRVGHYKGALWEQITNPAELFQSVAGLGG